MTTTTHDTPARRTRRTTTARTPAPAAIAIPEIPAVRLILSDDQSLYAYWCEHCQRNHVFGCNEQAGTADRVSHCNSPASPHFARAIRLVVKVTREAGRLLTRPIRPTERARRNPKHRMHSRGTVR